MPSPVHLFFSLLLQYLLGFFFLGLALSRFFRMKWIEDKFEPTGFPRIVSWIMGFFELMGAVLLLASVKLPFLAFFGAALLVLFSFVILFIQFARIKNSVWVVTASAILLLTLLAFLNPLGLKLMAFNRPVDAPVNPAKTETVATYPSGWFLESIAFDKEGNAYMTATFGSLFFDPGSKAASGQILKRAPKGKEIVFARLPIDLQGIVGALTIAEDGFVYVAVVSPSKPEVHGVWRFSPAGTGEQFSALPTDTGPNGLAFGPDGNLYLADSFRGCVWRIKIQSGEPEVWSSNELLKPRPIVALAPGPNGLKFWKDDLYVINSDKAIIVKIPLLKDGTSGEPSIHAEGVPGDDFAVDIQGTIYATTHAFDSIMRITQTGDISVIANQSQGVLGPTAAAFGILPGDQKNLYVVTDGGLFHQKENLVPSLMKLSVEIPQ